MPPSRNRSGRFVKSRSPSRAKSSRAKSSRAKYSRSPYSRSPYSRSRKQTVETLRDVDWKGRGASNTIAVQKSIEQANRLKVPVKSDHLSRLQNFRTQVVSLEYPTCPLSWERHTKSLKQVEDDYGVVWRTADNLFCAPPGLDADSLVPDDVEKKPTAYQLKKEIADLTTSLQHTFDPAAKAKYDTERAAKNAILANMASQRSISSGKQYEMMSKELAKKKKKTNEGHVKSLTEIFVQTGGGEDAAKASAEALLATAEKCVAGDEDGTCSPYSVIDKSSPSGKKTILIPKEVISSATGVDMPWVQALQNWWRRFRASDEAQKELERRKNDARYL